jgi:hypothetical protein
MSNGSLRSSPNFPPKMKNSSIDEHPAIDENATSLDSHTDIVINEQNIQQIRLSADDNDDDSNTENRNNNNLVISDENFAFIK